jgi:hypothetical protein
LSAPHDNSRNGSTPEAICLACGLCCNGVIFADVKLQPGDNPAPLQLLGLPLRFGRNPRQEAPASSATTGSVLHTAKFTQPCAAYDGRHCRIYSDRPRYCREFECQLLKNVRAGRTRIDVALAIIRTARRRADKVRRLLRQLGDSDDATALRVRVRCTSKRLEKLGPDDAGAEVYRQLTLAFHNLNLLLSEAFYPGKK